MLKAKTRLVSFRLSEGEYEEIRRLCDSEGARSLSEFLRSAFWRMVGTATRDEAPFEGKLERLRRRVEQLRGDVQELAVLARKDASFSATSQAGNNGRAADQCRDHLAG